MPLLVEMSIVLSSVRCTQVANLEKWHPAQHVVTESLSGAIVTQKIVCHGPSHPKLPQPSPGKHTGVAEFIFNGELCLLAGLCLKEYAALACARQQEVADCITEVQMLSPQVCWTVLISCAIGVAAILLTRA